MSVRIYLFSLVTAMALAPAAYAQETSPVRWDIHGGYSEPSGTTSDYVQGGWDFGGGVTFREPGSALGLRLDFDYSSYNATHQAAQVGSILTGLRVDGGHADVWSASVNLDAQHLFTQTMYGYVVAGIGVYNLYSQLEQYGYGYVCQPWWPYCYVGTGTYIVASKSTTKFGWNAGGGVAFRLQGGMTLFVEARFTQIETSPTAFQYIPINIGLRF
jgi:opacity protein-like surface antigen